eukprot:Transcript_8335.p1 GENE.Transcript_8335~~Transcript_8335.p1  ORF type:complete len:259 (+),score=40.34 Transcript_8335:50-778(+)
MSGIVLFAPLAAASGECTKEVATNCLLSRCVGPLCSSCDHECGGTTSSNPTAGRGWGAGGANAAFGGAESCLLGVQTSHPNPTGFRITLGYWAQGAILTWAFDASVRLSKAWGPVRAVQTRGSALSFMLLQPPAAQSRGDGRTDQWGFVLASPYEGQWRVDCGGAKAPPSPPSPPLNEPEQAAAEEAVVVEEGEETVEEPTETRRRRRGKGKGKGKGKRARLRRRRRRRRDAKKEGAEEIEE